MSILTKISVVVLVAVVLVASGVFINMATVPQNYRHLWQQTQVRAERLEQLARVRETEAMKLQNQRDQLRQELAREKRERVTDADQLQRQLADCKAQIAQAQKNKEAWEAVARKSQESLQAEQDRSTALREELRTQQARTNDAREEIRRLTDLISEKEVQIDRMAHLLQKRQLELAEKEKRIEELSARLAQRDTDGVTATPAAVEDVEVRGPQVPIYGTVTAYDTDDNIASINIGTAKGVKKNMKLTIFRGEEFVAYMRVEWVDVSNAIGVVTTKRLQPQQGDKVMTVSK